MQTLEDDKINWYKLFDSYQEACAVFSVGDLKKIKILDFFICVGRTAQSFFAIQDKCTHEGVSLTKGKLVNNGSAVECPWHHYLFDVSSGLCVSNKCSSITVYKIKIDQSGFYIGV